MRRSAGTLSVILCLMIVWPLMLQAQSRGIRVKAKDHTTGEQAEIQLYQKMVAVVIGINEYPNLSYDRQLSYAVPDAKAVERVLRERYQFDKIYTLYNGEATKEAIIELLQGTLAKTEKDDAVFIFFAGHAITEKTDYGEMGYLVPYDGTFKRDELYHNLSMSTLKTDISRRIKAKHVFYVVDACYGGLLLALRGSDRETGHDLGYLQEMTKEPVRQVLTAGSKDQPVLDGGPKGHSVFTGRLIEALESTTDYITGGELSQKIKRKVYSDAQARGHTQTPQDGALFGTGDFVFVPKQAAAPPPPPPPPPGQGDFSIEDLEAKAKEREQIKAEWGAYQRQMKSAYDLVVGLEKRDLDAADKAAGWQRFLDDYGSDNPYSQDDDAMRQKAHQQMEHWKEKARGPVRVTPSTPSPTGTPMVFIRGGTFQMGDQFGDGENDEKPVHTLTVGDFYLGTTEVTNAQFCEFLNARGNQTEGGVAWLESDSQYCLITQSGGRFVPKSGYEDHPVIEVSWYGAKAYCEWAGGRLPTEAEWEYAARSGGKKEKWAGTSSESSLGSYAWYISNAGGTTHPVGQKQPNGLGLYDMSGNVWEWCSDWYGSYPSGSVTNPTGPSSGANRVGRGGCCYFRAGALRCANRNFYSPDYHHFSLGFRLAKSP